MQIKCCDAATFTVNRFVPILAQKEIMMAELHLVFGGELVSPEKNVFKDVSALHLVGIFPDYESAYLAWKAEAQRTVDNAHMRYFIANLHRLREEGKKGSATEAMIA
jgi:hypothetical protein